MKDMFNKDTEVEAMNIFTEKLRQLQAA